MPSYQYASPFPQLSLSFDEREMLLRTANDLVTQAQEKYEWFLWQDRERLDADRWRFVRERDDMSVYHDRRPGADTGNRNMQLLLTTGSIPGTLHDAMYGVLNHSTDAARIKTAYVQDTLLDGAVLETMLAPTLDNPFQSLTLKWLVKGVPLTVRAVTKKHGDNVFIEYTGTRKLYNGEQIGFHLMQSVIMAEAPPLPEYHRCKLSICSLWRQMTRQRVQAYVTSYIEMPESFMIPLQIKSMADTFMAHSRVARCAQMKKLTWLVAQKTKKKELDETGSGSNSDSGVKGCSVCGSQCPSVFKCTSTCAVCSKPTCRRCRTKHELFTIGRDRELVKTKLRFCAPCLKIGNELDAAVVAQHDVLNREQPHHDHEEFDLKDGLTREARVSTGSSVASSVSTESGMFY